MSAPVEHTQGPLLSVVLPAPDAMAQNFEVLAAYGRQSLASRIEMVLVARDAGQPIPAEMMSPFHGCRVVPLPVWTSMTRARAVGVREATAPIVALAEDHCFPTPGWAEAMLRAHRQPWAAVGPAFVNANPATRVSWANFAVEYGPWLHPVARGAAAHVPGHNSSYKRDLLVAYGDDLEAMLEAESVLHWDLQRRGLQVAMEPDARVRHRNFSRWPPSIALRFCCGRLFAASRARGWPWWKRAVYAAGCPALPAIRTWRALRDLRRLDDTRPRRGLALAIAGLLVFDALGEAAGYALGVGAASRQLGAIEFNRQRFMSARDRVPTT
jgi:hypothetical protein